MIQKMRTLLLAWVLAAYEKVADRLHELDSPIALTLGAHVDRLRVQGQRGQLGLGTLLAAFVLVIAAFVVIIVVDQMDQALGDPNNSDLHNASNDTLSGFASMTSLIEPLLLIAIGVVIISLIRRVQ